MHKHTCAEIESEQFLLDLCYTCMYMYVYYIYIYMYICRPLLA